MGLFRESAEHKAARLERKAQHKADYEAKLAEIDQKYGARPSSAATPHLPQADGVAHLNTDLAEDAVRRWARNAEPATRLAATTASLDAINTVLGVD